MVDHSSIHGGRARQSRTFGEYPERDLAGERCLAPRVPAVVELAPEPVDPFRRRLVRRVRRRGRVPEQERPVRMRDAQLVQVGDRVVGEIGIEVVAVGRFARRFDMVRVTDEIRCPLIGFAVEEPVVTVETEPGRPHVVRPRHPLIARDEVPLPDTERRVAVGAHDLRKRSRRTRHTPRVRRKVRRKVGQHAHPDAVMIAARQQTCPSRRTHRGRMEVRETQPARRQPIEIGRQQIGAIAPEVRKAQVVAHDHHHVRCTGAKRRLTSHALSTSHRRGGNRVTHRTILAQRRAPMAQSGFGTRSYHRAVTS